MQKKHLKNLNSFLIFKKAIMKAALEGNFFNMIMDIYKKYTANTILSGEILSAFTLESGTKK